MKHSSGKSAAILSSRVSSQRGLTLVEIVIVLTILTILFAYLTSGLFATGNNQKARINAMKLDKLKGSVNQYQLMNNGLPPSLDALVNCAGNNGQPCFPVAQADDLNDLFGGQFRYTNSGNTFTIKSLGADKKDGGSGADQDVSVTGP